MCALRLVSSTVLWWLVRLLCRAARSIEVIMASVATTYQIFVDFN